MDRTPKEKRVKNKKQKTTPAYSAPNSGRSVSDLLAEFGSLEYPQFWPTTHRFLRNSEVNKATLERIVNDDWIADEAINAFLLTRLSLSPEHPTKFLLFNTFHTGYVKNGLIFSAKVFIRKMRPFGYDVWLTPANVGANHWALFVVLPHQKVVLYVDSVNMSATSEFKSVTAIIQYSLQVQDEDARLENWVAIKCTDVVQQNNASDCGVFLRLFAQIITSGEGLDIQPGDGKVGRIWLVWELCCADEPKNTVHAPWAKIGELAKDDLPVSLMKVKSWDKKTPSTVILSKILSRSLESNFRDDIV